MDERYVTGDWAEAARSWMAIRARWPERVTMDMSRKGETAAQRWGAQLANETEL